MFLPAFGTFLSVVSAFVMSHKPNLRPVLEREQSNQLRSADMTRQTAKGKGRTWWELAKPGGFFAGAKLSQLRR